MCIRDRHFNIHWRPQYNLCDPCHIKYDFIGHYETLQHDAEHVLRQITRYSNNTHVQFPATDADNPHRNSHDLLRKSYAKVSRTNIRRLLRLYKKDYEVFGYKVPLAVRRMLGDQTSHSASRPKSTARNIEGCLSAVGLALTGSA